jgi:hypothetical protein
MTTGGTSNAKPRWRKLIIIAATIALIFGGIAGCQAIRANDPKYQCEQRNAVWVDGYGQEPHCADLTPIKRK